MNNVDFSLLANHSLARLQNEQPNYRLGIVEGKLQWLSPDDLQVHQAAVSVEREKTPIVVAIDAIAQSALQSVRDNTPQNPEALDRTLQNLEWINSKLEKHNQNLQWRHSIRLFLCNFFRKLIGFNGLDYETLDLAPIRQAKEKLENASPPPSPKPANHSNPTRDNEQDFFFREEEEAFYEDSPTPSQHFQAEQEEPIPSTFVAPQRPTSPVSIATRDLEQLSTEELPEKNTTPSQHFQAEQEEPIPSTFVAPQRPASPVSIATQDLEPLSAEETRLLEEKRAQGKQALQAHIGTLSPERAWVHFKNITGSNYPLTYLSPLTFLEMLPSASRARLLAGPCNDYVEKYYYGSNPRFFLIDQELNVHNVSFSPDQWEIIDTLLDRGIQNILDEFERSSLRPQIATLPGWPADRTVRPNLQALQRTLNQLSYLPNYIPTGISRPLFYIYNTLERANAETTSPEQIFGNEIGFPGYEILTRAEQPPTIRRLELNQQGQWVYTNYRLLNAYPYWSITTSTFERFAPQDVVKITRAQRIPRVMNACLGQNHIEQLFESSSWADSSSGNQYFFFFRNTSYHNDGTWADRMDQFSSLPESHRLVMALDLMHGVLNLHSKGWLHRDLKPASILLQRIWGPDRNFYTRASIGNLGVACPCNESDPRSIPDLESGPIPPETIGGTTPWTQAADNWTVGILLLQLFYPQYYRREFGQKSGEELHLALSAWTNEENRLPVRTSSLEDPVAQAIRGLTHNAPEKRMALDAAATLILQHLQSIDNTWRLFGDQNSPSHNWTLHQQLPSSEQSPQSVS